MTFKAKFKDITREWNNNIINITFSLLDGNLNEINGIQDKTLSVEVKEYRKKRSLDANAYLWVLCSKMADALKTSKDEVYEELLQRYGYIYKDEDGYITVTVKACVDMSKIQGHWKFYKGNDTFSSYLMIKGTSEYDTSEMAHFLDMAILEAQALGIETETPNEIERMKALWGKG